MSEDEKDETAAAAAEPKKRAAKPAAHRPTKEGPWTVKDWNGQDLYLCTGKLVVARQGEAEVTRPCAYDTFSLAEMQEHAKKQHPGA